MAEIKNRFTDQIIAQDKTLSLKELVIKSYADLSSADLSYANLSSANLSSADLRSADLSSANLSSADLSYANLSSADLSYANLRSANLSYADLSSADLRYADLRYANLSYANLRSADLRYANLSYANLSSADLSYANLSYANLSSADLSSADLRYADLSYAKNIGFHQLPSIRLLSSIPLGVLSDALMLELLRRDAYAHPYPERFDEWVKTGVCPYQDEEYFWHFDWQSVKHLWKPGNPEMRDSDLILAICKEKGWKVNGYEF